MVGWYAPGYSVVTMEQIVEDGREMKILSSILLEGTEKAVHDVILWRKA